MKVTTKNYFFQNNAIDVPGVDHHHHRHPRRRHPRSHGVVVVVFCRIHPGGVS
jgi:hypothetical protein